MSMVVKNSVTEVLQRITVCGLGKLGTCVAACLAARGFDLAVVESALREPDPIAWRPRKLVREQM